MYIVTYNDETNEFKNKGQICKQYGINYYILNKVLAKSYPDLIVVSKKNQYNPKHCEIIKNMVITQK